MSVKTPANCSVQAHSTRPGTPSGPAAFRAFTLLRMSQTSEVENWSASSPGETSDLKAASLFSRSNRAQEWFSSSGREVEEGGGELHGDLSVSVCRPCRWEELKCSSLDIPFLRLDLADL